MSSNLGNTVRRVEPFLNDARKQLEATHQFGALGSALSPTCSPSRFDYVTQHCQLLLKIKQDVPWLGLVSSIGAQGREELDLPDLEGWNGLEICQAWTVLLNSGHLFGTFATERGLLFHLDRELRDRHDFLDGVSSNMGPSRDKLRGVIQKSIGEARLHRFHYVLALWRLRDNGVSKLLKKDLKIARQLIWLFVIASSAQVLRLKDIWRRSRQIAYLDIHKRHLTVRSAGSPQLTTTNDDLRSLFPADSLPEADWIARSEWQVLDASDKRDYVQHFNSSSAATAVLSHIKAFKPWLERQKKSGKTLSSIVDDLFFCPTDWSETSSSYKAFVGLRVPSGLDWLTETRLWLKTNGREDPWSDSNFLVSPDPRGGIMSIDLYAGDKGLSIRSLRHCVMQLSRAFSGGHAIADSADLWMSTARLAARAFQACLNSGYIVRINPVAAEPGHVGYASAGETYEMVRGLVKRFLVFCHDAGRSTELRLLLAALDKRKLWRSPVLLVIARTTIADASTNKMVAEIDGLCGVFLDDAFKWLVLECKKAHSGNGATQLNKKLAQCLKDPLQKIERESYFGQNVWSTFVNSPAALS